MIGDALWSLDMGDYVNSATCNSNGLVVAGSLSGSAYVIDPNDGRVTKLMEHPLGVLSAGWNSSGSLVATGGHDGRVRIHSVQGVLIGEVEVGGWVNDLAWAADSDLLAVASGRYVSLLNVGPHSVEILRRYPELASTVTAVRWAATGSRVGATAYGGVTWYDPEKDSDQPARVHEFTGSALSLALSPSGRWACAGYQDSSIHLWRLWSGDDLSMSGYPSKIELLAFRDDSEWMASACVEEITIWSFAGRGPKGSAPARAAVHDRHVTAMQWEPGGRRLLSAGGDGRVILWPSPRRTKEELAPLWVHHSDEAVASACWHLSGQMIVLGYADGRVECRPVDPA